MRRWSYQLAAIAAVTAGLLIALLAIRLDWGLWAVYGAIVLAGIAVAGVTTPFILGPISRHREHPAAGSEHSVRF